MSRLARQWDFGFHRKAENSWPAKRLLASHEGLCSREAVKNSLYLDFSSVRNYTSNQFATLRPTKCTIQFLRYLHYNTTLHTATCFDPQPITIREPTNTILHKTKWETFYTVRGTRWRSWLRHCSTSRKVTGSIPDGVTGIFHWHKPFGRAMALGSTQPLT
jgi:hypothetical protein